MIQNFNNCDNVHGWIPLSMAGTYICSSCSERKQLLHFRFWREQLFVEVVASSSEEALVRYVLVYVIQNCYMPTCVFCATMLWHQYWFQAHFCVGSNWKVYYYHPTWMCWALSWTVVRRTWCASQVGWKFTSLQMAIKLKLTMTSGNYINLNRKRGMF